MTINILDVGIIGATVVSAIIGLFRGATKEVITLITWIFAGIAAMQYGLVVGEYFTSVKTELVRHCIGGFILFIGVIIVGGIINFIVGKLVKLSGFTTLDKILGAFFGIVRSLLIVLITLLVFPFINDILADKPWWQESILLPKFKDLAADLESSMPEGLKEYHLKFLESLPQEQNKS